MKNLKKVLALVLVVATLMGFATVASATFTDADKIEYTEAVDVLSAINVIKGYTDGSFKPTDTVSRAEMAKMVTMIISGGEDVGNLYAAANTFSDCTTNWAKGYIAYANKTGIVAGVGGGKFNPTGDVTGTQAAKMMLCALGYDATAEEYTGTNWSVNVLSDARDAGLLEGLEGVDMGAHMTREQTAQLMFNALKADMVKYDNGNINISSGDTNITIAGSKAEPVANTTAKDYRTTVSARDEVMQLCEKYFSDLKLTVATADVFGRPAQKWVYEKKDVGTYTTEADTTYTAEVKSKEIYADLGLTKTINASVYTDGGNPTAFSVAKNATTPLGGQGVLVEVYYDVNAETVDICVINTYVGEVSSVYEDADEPYSVIAGLTGNGGEFETTAFAEDDIVLYTYADGEIQSVAKAEKVEGAEVSSVTTDKNDSDIYVSLKADGTSYDVADVYGLDSKLSSTIDKDTSYNLYLDSYGNVIYVGYYEAASSNYAYVLDAVVKTDDFTVSEDYYTVKLLKADGTVVTVLSDVKSNAADPSGSWVTYIENDDGSYDISSKTTVSKLNNHNICNIMLTNGTAKFDVKTSSSHNDEDSFYANSNTVFVIHDQAEKTYTSYTGINNVPSVKDGNTYAGATAVAIYATTGDVAKYVYIDLANSNNVSGATSDVIYIVAGSKSDLISDELGEYYEYNAVVNGEITTLKIEKDVVVGSDQLIKGVTTNSKGLVTALGSDVAGLKGGVGTAKADADTIGLNGEYYTYASDVNVYKIDDNKLSVSSINAIKDDTNDSVKFVLDDGTVTDIFYTVVTGADQSAQASSEMKTYIDNADLDSANSGIASMSMSGNTITMDITKANFGGSGIVSGMAGEFNVTVSKIEVGASDYGTDAVSAAGAMKTAIKNAADASAATVETGKTATGSISQTIKLTFADGSVGTYTLVANWAVAGTKPVA